jgi:hypothetical protein
MHNTRRNLVKPETQPTQQTLLLPRLSALLFDSFRFALCALLYAINDPQHATN